jgi:NADH-quinone oxidoreductase subunit G
MTITNSTPATGIETVTVTIDGIEMQVPKGTLLIRAAEQIGVQIPRFCDHPSLEPVAACRACLVDIEGQPKPQPSCAITVADGMKVRTQHTSEVADAAQKGVMEFLLINHPLDCPVCDKGGECPLQNQAMSNGRSESRFDGAKREFEKPINVSAQILLDRERCVSCARCTRFAEQIAGDPMIALLERGAHQQVGTSDEEPFDSYFSGNTIQICPVGALTSAKYRFRSRPFDLVSVPTSCEHCASGCALRTDIRRGVVQRRLAWDDAQVNEEWNCDKGRFAFQYAQEGRLTNPLVRGADGALRAASWPEAVAAAAAGLARAKGHAAVLAGGRHTIEDAYAISKFARVALATDDVDFRSRALSAEETAFLSSSVAGLGIGVTYEDLEKAAHVVLIALEPEDESPMIQLRLRKAVRRNRTRVTAIASHATNGLEKLNANVIKTKAGAEVPALVSAGIDANTIVLVGERAASVPGLLSAVLNVTRQNSAQLAWVPRRAGDRGAVDAGLLPGLLPGGRALVDAASRAEVAAVWGVDVSTLPATPGRDFNAIVDAAINGDVQGLLITGVDAEDTQNPTATIEAIYGAGFVVSLEQRPTAVTALADVVFPVASVAEKSGAFVDWEGRQRPFGQALQSSTALTDARVLAMIADAMDVLLGRQDVAALREEMSRLSAPAAVRVDAPNINAHNAEGITLNTWPQLLDEGTMQSGEPFLAATARVPMARMSAATAAKVGVVDGQMAVVTTDQGALALQVEVVDAADDTVWLPTNSANSHVRSALAAAHGDSVRISNGGAA